MEYLLLPVRLIFLCLIQVWDDRMHIALTPINIVLDGRISLI